MVNDTLENPTTPGTPGTPENMAEVAATDTSDVNVEAPAEAKPEETQTADSAALGGAREAVEEAAEQPVESTPVAEETPQTEEAPVEQKNPSIFAKLGAAFGLGKKE